MTEKKLKILLKVVKYFLITLFVGFFIIICVQSIQITNLKNKQNTLQTTLTQKEEINSQYENQISQIENNFDKYSEEELRKNDYIKENETLVK